MPWKMATFNVNGIRARLPIVIDWLQANRPDALCLQETKCQDKDFPHSAFEEIGYRASIRGQKAYNGVAILSLEEPEELELAFGDGGDESEARFMAAKFGPLMLLNTYVPMGRAVDDPAFEAKLTFFDRVRAWLDGRFKPTDPIIWTGDLNVAREPRDVHDPKRLDGQVGFHPLERAKLNHCLDWGLTDLFREFNDEDKQYSFWDYRMPKGFERHLGWRLDLILVTAPLAQAAIDCTIDTAPRVLTKPSDHTPVVGVFDLAGLGN